MINHNKKNLEKRLRATLELAGIHELDIAKIKTHRHGYTSEDRKEVHNATNQLLEECLSDNSLGECIHITGEMRALTDPFHRYLCEKINQKDKDVFKVVYNLPQEHIKNPTKILEWNLENWTLEPSNRQWSEELRTIYSIANRSVNLYALDTSNEIQYSVFGHKYILFQEKHKDKANKKNTWLLESEALNSMLTIKAEELIHKAKNVNEGNYRRFTQNLNSVASKRFLSLLQNNTDLSWDSLMHDEVAIDFADSPEEILDSLRVMNFINVNIKKQVSITQAGKEFFL